MKSKLENLRSQAQALLMELDLLLAETDKVEKPRVRQDLKSKRVTAFEINTMQGKWRKPQQLRK